MADYYASPLGSNTSPYDTWAKAATNPNTALGAVAAGGGHRVIIAGNWALNGIGLSNPANPGVSGSRNTVIFDSNNTFTDGGGNHSGNGAGLTSFYNTANTFLWNANCAFWDLIGGVIFDNSGQNTSTQPFILNSKANLFEGVSIKAANGRAMDITHSAAGTADSIDLYRCSSDSAWEEAFRYTPAGTSAGNRTVLNLYRCEGRSGTGGNGAALTCPSGSQYGTINVERTYLYQPNGYTINIPNPNLIVNTPRTFCHGNTYGPITRTGAPGDNYTESYYKGASTNAAWTRRDAPGVITRQMPFVGSSHVGFLSDSALAGEKAFDMDGTAIDHDNSIGPTAVAKVYYNGYNARRGIGASVQSGGGGTTLQGYSRGRP